MRSPFLSLVCAMALAAFTFAPAVAVDEAVPVFAATEPAPVAPAPVEASDDQKAMDAVIAAAKAKDPEVETKIATGTAWFGTYAKKTNAKGEAVDGTCIVAGTEAKDDKGALVPMSGTSPLQLGDNAWMLMCCAMVLLMTAPGLALFYGGLVRQKNVIATMMQSFALMGIVTVIWVIFGFSMAFAPGSGSTAAFFGDPTKYSFLAGVVWDSGLFGDSQRYPISYDYAPTISFGLFAMFQLMFAIITPALITGAFAERMKFSAMVAFCTIWLVVVYLPLAHMVWGVDGFFNWWNAKSVVPTLDFAGGTVVHISSGVAALVCALFLGKRKGYPGRPIPPHSLVLSFIGAALLWFGWFGFNGGSALGAGGLAVLAFANTQIACAAAAVSWTVVEWIMRGKPTVLGAISGAVAGLVAITPACGFVTPASALIIGLIGGGLCFAAVTYMKRALGYDDALDAFGIHGIGGIWGAIATGMFVNIDVNAAIPALTMFPGGSYYYAKVIAGEISPLTNQIIAVGITVVFSAVASAIILTIVKFTIGLRVNEEEEERGLDLAQHGEEGYNNVM